MPVNWLTNSENFSVRSPNRVTLKPALRSVENTVRLGRGLAALVAPLTCISAGADYMRGLTEDKISPGDSCGALLHFVAGFAKALNLSLIHI